jgi:hypothetical protein
MTGSMCGEPGLPMPGLLKTAFLAPSGPLLKSQISDWQLLFAIAA